MKYFIGKKCQSSPNYASVNTLQDPSVASGLQARRGFEGVYLASCRPTRRRGRAGARDGGGGGSG